MTRPVTQVAEVAVKSASTRGMPPCVVEKGSISSPVPQRMPAKKLNTISRVAEKRLRWCLPKKEWVSGCVTEISSRIHR